MQAMILAAGFGTRLLPHTLIRPKPLFPILNKPLLLCTIKRLQRLGFDHILVNCHHLREQIISLLKHTDGVVVLPEETILGTGGGLRNALPFMREEPVLVTNGDIYHTIDFKKVYLAHCDTHCHVSLVMHDYPRFNTVSHSNARITSFRAPSDPAALAFTGIHVLDPQVLNSIQLNKESCILERYTEMISEGNAPTVLMAEKCFWTDMGTPADYLQLNEGLLKGDIPCWEELARPQTTFLIEAQARLADDLILENWAALGAITCGHDVTLNGVVAWDGVNIADNQSITTSILSS